MKRKSGLFLTILLSLLMTIGVYADSGLPQNVDYGTDYYMIVETKEGGTNLYSEPDKNSPTLNDELIPNGTAIHVEGERKSEDGKDWAYAQRHGMYGFISMDDLKPATRGEAIRSELAVFGAEDVDYKITVNAKDGSISLYYGPEKKYGVISAAGEIANGQELTIMSEVDTGKDGRWGMTDVDGYTGWINLDTALGQDELLDMNAGETEDVAAVGGGLAETAPSVTVSPTAAVELTQTPTPTATQVPTETPTPEPTETPVPTAAPEATPTEAPKEVSPTQVPGQTGIAASPTTDQAKPTEGADAAEDQTESSWTQNPVIWGLFAAIILVLLLIVILLRKSKNEPDNKEWK